MIHFHTDYLHFPLSRRCSRRRTLTTLHGRLDLPDLAPLYREFPDLPLVSISDAQRAPLPRQLGRAPSSRPAAGPATGPAAGQGGYLAFLGRISPEKRPDRAIEIARRAGHAAADRGEGRRRANAAYFEREIEPLLDEPHVEFLGEIGEQREERASSATRAALLFPIDWPEPFGLVMIEAMACGTPVIAFPCGSVPEVIDDGVTGFDRRRARRGGRRRCGRVARARPAALPRSFERRFTAERMARDYLERLRARWSRTRHAESRGVDA